MALWRDTVGRVGVIVFFTGLGSTITCATALMLLFRTVGAFGEARSFAAHFEAAVATGVVVLVSSSIVGVFFLTGWLLIDRFVRVP